jgi:hypothetical protein
MDVIEAGLYRFLSDPRNKLAVLGSIASDGSGAPQAALVGVAASPGLELIFDTVRSSRKYRNLLADPRCSFVIGLGGDVTVQFEGIAREVEDAESKAIYFSAFPDGPSRASWPGIVYFAVKPTWIRYSDYGETPPVIEEFRF